MFLLMLAKWLFISGVTILRPLSDQVQSVLIGSMKIFSVSACVGVYLCAASGSALR